MAKRRGEPLEFTDGMIREARRLLKEGKTQFSVAKKFGCSIEGLMRHVDEAYRVKVNARGAAWQRANRPKAGNYVSGRKRRALGPFQQAPVLEWRSAGAELMGEPAKGRSALDKLLADGRTLPS